MTKKEVLDKVLLGDSMRAIIASREKRYPGEIKVGSVKNKVCPKCGKVV